VIQKGDGEMTVETRDEFCGEVVLRHIGAGHFVDIPLGMYATSRREGSISAIVASI